MNALSGYGEIDLVNNKAFVSDEVYRIFGLSPEDFPNKIEDFRKYIHPDDADKVISGFNRAVDTESVFRQIYRINDSTGREKFVFSYGYISGSESNKTKKMTGIIQDVTFLMKCKQRLIDEKAKYNNLTENAPFGIATINDYKFRKINSTLKKMLGYSNRQSIYDANILDHITDEDKIRVIDLLALIEHGNIKLPYKLNIPVMDIHGNIMYCDIFLSSYTVDNIKNTQAVIIDNTEKYISDKKTRQLAADALYINQKNSILAEIHNELEKILFQKETYRISDFRKIFDIIESYSQLDKDWDVFRTHFEEVYPEFFDKLKLHCSSLTINDLKHCACIKMNFDTKEIARFFNVKTTTIQMARVRLKKKLQLSESTDLRNFITSL